MAPVLIFSKYGYWYCFKVRNFRERISCDFTFFCQNSFCEKFDLIWYHKLILVKGFNFWASKVFFSPKREQNRSIVLKNYKYCSSREFGRFLNIRHDPSRIIPYYGIIQWYTRVNTIRFHFLILQGGLLVIMVDCMIFLSPFLVVTRMPMSTDSFLDQLNSGILCL